MPLLLWDIIFEVHKNQDVQETYFFLYLFMSNYNNH
jgi:hypothetical protein